MLKIISVDIMVWKHIPQPPKWDELSLSEKRNWVKQVIFSQLTINDLIIDDCPDAPELVE